MVRRGLQLRDIDHGYTEMVRRIYGFAHPRIAVGILASQGAALKREHPGHGGHAPQTVIDVATDNEFGTDRIPARSFIRAWFDENEDKLRRDFAVLMRSVLQGRRRREDILQIIGLRAVGEIQKRIADGIPPPNSLATMRAKHSSTPLIDTGQLRGSISHRVEGL